MEQEHGTVGVDFGQYIEERFGNFPLLTKHEIFWEYADLFNGFFEHPGQRFVLFSKRDFPYTGPGSCFNHKFVHSWLLGYVAEDVDFSMKMEEVGRLIVGQCLFIPECDYGLPKDISLTTADNHEVAEFLLSLFDAKALALESVKLDAKRLKTGLKTVANPPDVSLLFGNEKIMEWTNGTGCDEADTLLELADIIGWTFACETGKYAKREKTKRLIRDHTQCYDQLVEHVTTLKELLDMVREHDDPARIENRLMDDLGIKQ